MNISLDQDWGGSYWGSSSKNYREIKKKPSVIPVFKNHKYNTLSFKHVSLDEIAKEVKVLSVKKVCQDTDIFTNIIERNLINCIAYSVFPSSFKNANITPVHRKKIQKSNCRPVNILVNMSKIYEKCIFSQISNYFEKILSRYQLGFRKGYSTQQYLLGVC